MIQETQETHMTRGHKCYEELQFIKFSEGLISLCYKDHEEGKPYSSITNDS